MSTLLTSDELRQVIFEAGIAAPDVLIADAEYALPTLDYVRGEFAAACQIRLNATVGPYEPEDSDCDDFADVAACFMRECHRKTLDKPRETAIAFAEFWYTRDDGAGHAINAFVANVKGQTAIYYFEPQLCQVVNLSKAEIASCEFIRF